MGGKGKLISGSLRYHFVTPGFSSDFSAMRDGVCSPGTSK